MNRHSYSGLLYSQLSFLEGFARILDIGGTFDAYNDSSSAAEADRLASLADWYAVGADLHNATRDFGSRVGVSPSDQINAPSE